ncbi:MAG: DsbC family protein [Nitrospirae bacterium]|nr:MAG: DsbC family protein [Nitrospirota bacterium]
MYLIVIRLSIVLIFILKLGVSDGLAFGESGCSSDCAKCHSLTVQEVDNIIKKIAPPRNSIKVVDIRPGRIKSLWEIIIEERGAKGLIYIDFAKKNLIEGPLRVIEIDAPNKKSEAPIERPPDKRIDARKIPLDEALVLGNPSAKTKVIVFTDPDCPYCGRFHKELQKAAANRADIVFYLKLYPLKIHRDAYWKSKTIVCNRSLKTLEDVYGKKPIDKKDCATKEVDETIKLADSLGIDSTPTVILPDGTVIAGSMPSEKLIRLIDGSK